MPATSVWTHLARATDKILRQSGTSLDEIIAQGRDRGQSYEKIARRIYALTGETIDVSGRTVQRWAGELV